MTPKRAPGRPRLDPSGPSVNVHLRLGPRQYDALYAQARRDRESVVDVIRRALDLADDRDPRR